jgi:hypothetical protein
MPNRLWQEIQALSQQICLSAQMANKLDEMKPRLAELSNERAQLDVAIEEMIRAVVKKT